MALPGSTHLFAEPGHPEKPYNVSLAGLVLGLFLAFGLLLLSGMPASDRPLSASDEVIPPTGDQDAPAPGVVAIDSQDPHYFIRDGQFWYPAGYYPNIAALTADQTDYERYYREFFDLLAENGINYTRNVFNMGQPYGDSRTVYLRTGPGTAADGGAKFDLTRFDPDHFDYWRRVIEYAGEKGIVVQLVILDSWHNKRPVIRETEAGPEWGMKFDFYCASNNINGVDACDSQAWHNPQDEVFDFQKALVREVVQELGDLPNIIWEISNENYYNPAWELQLADLVSEVEDSLGYPRHLVMPRDLPNHDEAGGKENDLARTYSELILNRRLRRPLIADNDGGGSASPEGRRKKAWTALTAGGHISYFHGGLYDREVLYAQDTREGMRFIGLLRKFLNDYSIDLREMQPCPAAASRGHCLGRPGQDFIIYLLRGGSLEVSPMPAPVQAFWFDPRSGESQPAQSEDGRFTAPTRDDWVLYITAADQEE